MKCLRPLSKNNYSIDDALTFLDLLRNAEEPDDYDDVSYDVESLFTSIPAKETIDCLYNSKKLCKEQNKAIL